MSIAEQMLNRIQERTRGRSDADYIACLEEIIDGLQASVDAKREEAAL
jgi:hypothetical protein